MTNKHRISTLLGSLLLLTPLVHGCSDDDGEEPRDPGDAAIDAARADAGDARIDATQGPSADASPGDAASDSAVPTVADTWAVTSAGRLLRFARADGSLSGSLTLTGIPAGETLLGVDIRPSNGQVTALVRVDASNAGKLYVIDPATGAATLKSTLSADAADASEPFTALSGAQFGVDFNPVPDRLRVVSDTGQNLRINVDSGATITDGVVTPATPGIAAAAYTQSFGAACRTQLFVVDAANRKLLLQDPPNDGRVTERATIGDANLGTLHDLDIQTTGTGANVAIFAATASDGERVGTFDLTTGAVTASVKLALNQGETLRAVLADLPATPPTQALGELLATTASNKLVSFNRGAPGKLCTSVAISGLAAQESVLGADVRPADKALYALGSSGKLYTVALDTGIATLKSTLTAAANDDAPFTALAAGEYGVGFNPVADRLRVVGPNQTNLRINVDDGATTTDSALSAGSNLSATAYTNAFAGTRSTAMYGLDHGTDALVRVGSVPANGAACPNDTNPNCGVVTAVGALNAGDITDLNGFDIDPTTGVALAALRVGDAANSTLLAINLATGAAALPTGVANGTIGGGEPVRSLTFAVAPTLTAWVATADGKLLAFAPSAPASALKTLTITGLQTDEVLIGIDVRPLDGRLYAAGSSGRLYALDTETGAATASATLTAASGQTFSGLPASTFGFDFNPAADALRIVDLAGDNFRILPSTRAAGPAGATFVDTALSGGANATAAGYTNNFANATTTTLFVLDSVGGRLLRQGGVDGMPSPNGGALTDLGALGVTSTGGANFDIVGGHNGLALAALTAADNTTSLYSVNLASGVATPYNAAANAIAGTAAPLRGLALTLR